MTLDEIVAGISDSIANARPDVKREHAQILQELASGVRQRKVEMMLAALERLDLNDHYPAIRRPDGMLEPQPMPGGWTSWYGWMQRLKALEEAPYLKDRRAAATPDIAGTDRR